MTASNFQKLAMSMINSNPQVKNNPNAQEWIKAIESNDSRQGEQIARNLCQSYGVDPQTALQQARRFFNI